MVRICDACGEESASLRRCSGCKSAWYCSTECQRSNWVRHIFHCNPRRPINSADRLALACYEDLIPTDQETLDHYGFTKAFTPRNSSNLLGLYIGLITYQHINPQALHRWRLKGTLIQEIKALYEKIPPDDRGGYYPWFLENQYLLDPSSSQTGGSPDDMLVLAWRFTGGSADDSPETVRAAIEREPKTRRDCHQFYTVLLADFHPSPDMELWLKFGLCAFLTQSLYEEMQIAKLYKALITDARCKFEEFHQAYATSSLVPLFKLKGLWDNPPRSFGISVNRSLLEDVLQHSPTRNKSVWNLKQFISIEDPDGIESGPVRSVVADFGFCNCETKEAKMKLREMYKELFQKEQTNPLELHQACIQGKLYEYCEKRVKLEPQAFFKQVLRNVYPLPEY